MSGRIPTPFPFFGSKDVASAHYPPPAHDEPCEPFAGSASYARRHGCRSAILVEKDPTVARLWRYLIGAKPEDILRLPLLPNAGDKTDDHAYLRQEERDLIGFWLNRNSAMPKRTRTAYSARTDRGQLVWGERARERTAYVVTRIKAWTVIEGDFSAAPDIETTWFIDPPYADKGRYYRHRLTAEDFPRVAEFARSRRGQVIVCEGDNHGDWLPFRPLGSFKSARGRAQEFVWTNDRGDLLEQAA